MVSLTLIRLLTRRILCRNGFFLIGTLLAIPATAEDLPGGAGTVTTLTGNGLQASGIVKTYTIPVSNWPEVILFNVVRGGDGGSAQAGPSNNPDRFKASGGGGAQLTGRVIISPDANNALRPGGELRFIPGNKGLDMDGGSGGARVAGGGGGSSGILYKGPEPGADWELLVIAGGGGGAAVGSFALQEYEKNGLVGNILESSTGTPIKTNGQSGTTYGGGSGGGAGWLISTAGDQSGDRGIMGGAGGRGNNGDGGFGLTGGGAANRSDIDETGGGGGGGYSGGSAGSLEDPGGGGGSYFGPQVFVISAVQRETGSLNGQIIWGNGALADTALPGPTLTVNGPSVTILDWNENWVNPGATAEDYYGNSLTVTNEITGTPENFQVTFEATDRWGRTVEEVTQVMVRDQNKPTFQLSGDITELENTELVVVENFFTNFNPNDPDQAFVSVRLEVSNPDLFSPLGPQIDSQGTLSFNPKPNVIGTSQVSVYASDNGTMNTESDPVTFTVTIEGTKLNNFRRANAMSLDGSDDFEDASVNGIPNIFYYAFGMGDINQSEVAYTSGITNQPGLPSVVRFNNSFLVTYTRCGDDSADGISSRLFTSTDLKVWVDVGTLEAPDSPISSDFDNAIGQPEYEIVILEFATVAERRFFRVEVTVD